MKNKRGLRSIEFRVSSEIKSEGISALLFDELLPSDLLDEITALSESTLNDSSTQLIIEESVAKVSMSSSELQGKYYQINLWDQLQLASKKILVNLASRNEILAIVSNYMGMSCTLSYVDLWYNIPMHGQDVLFQQWHRDVGDRSIVKLYLYLRDVDDLGGPFSFIRGSHDRSGYYELEYPRWLPLEIVKLKSELTLDNVVNCTGKAGTLVFSDTTGLHKGGHVFSRSRLIFYAMYTSDVGRPVDASYDYGDILKANVNELSPAQSYATRPRN